MERHYSALGGAYSTETRTTPALINAERAGARHREIDDPPADEWTTFVDAGLDHASAMGHLEHAAERARAMGAGQLVASAGLHTLFLLAKRQLHASTLCVCRTDLGQIDQ